MAIIAKRTIMSLYSDSDDVFSHQVRIVLAEKGVNVEITTVKPEDLPEDLVAFNPYRTLPILIDRDLTLFKSRIIMEYLDERFPHPPLLPVYPVARAESRKMIHRILKDWYSLMHLIVDNDDDQARNDLLESLTSLEPVFKDKPYFLSEEFSLLDCVLAPLLWRLPCFDIHLDEVKNPFLLEYMQRVFNRDSFQASLTDAERQLRAA